MITINDIRQSQEYPQIKALSESGKKVVCQKVGNTLKLVDFFDSKGDCWRFIEANKLRNVCIFNKI